jgi:hypothetical protein
MDFFAGRNGNWKKPPNSLCEFALAPFSNAIFMKAKEIEKSTFRLNTLTVQAFFDRGSRIII